MSTDTFVITRSDGRSNAQVVLDYVKGGAPGRLYTYDELASALDVGTDKVHGPLEVCRVVRESTRRMLKEQQRRLHNVRLVGFRLAPAVEHMALAHRDKRRADVQLQRGLETLRHVRWEEMDDNDRRAHEGHLMLTEALYANQAALDQRLRKIEDAIAQAQAAPAG